MTKENLTEAQSAKSETRGCGRHIGGCGGNHQDPVSVSTTCQCGRKVKKRCSKKNCSGVEWYC